ncbi:MAG: hypothetical protein DPW18_04625 [Chloroflexi bacterium]|nr:hypothetical protein [Chloroflexota bacterium]MDL1942647.1 hypothetical protein [Chloroflexi bacterium CFX2]
MENLPPPPGIVRSIKAGFDAIASHVTAILFPLLLNLFLWLGPRLRMDALFNSIKGDVVTLWQAGGVSAEEIQRVLTWYDSVIPRVNLFWLLRTLPVGISSLPLPQEALSTPLGDPAIWQVGALSFAGWIFLLTFAGWIGGALYFRNVSWTVLTEKEQTARMPQAFMQTVLISLFCTVFLTALGLPILFLLTLAAQVHIVLANIFVLFLSLASVWVIVPIFFWPFGVFMKRQNALTSMLSSIQLTRFTLPTSSLFVLTVFLLATGLNFLWSLPSEDSWMTLVGIFGHSFVTTALLAGSFIYYRDMSEWIQVVLEKLRPSGAVKQA